MKQEQKIHPLAVVILVNIALTIILLSAIEMYLLYNTENDSRDWYVARFCRKAEENNFKVIDITEYRNGWDGIYRLDYESPNIRPATKNHFNGSGFTGNDLVPVETTRPRVLFIGDSHVFGVAAHPILENRFTSLVEKQGFHTYNTGIGGLDVVQYGLIAKKYIPRLKPDYVVLVLFLGNDIDRAPSPVAPTKHLYFQTNFDWVQGYDGYGRSFGSAQEAVDHWLKLRCGSSLDPTMRFFMKSRLFQKAYRVYLDAVRSLWGEKSVNNDNEWIADTIDNIAALAKQNGALFKLLVIPDKHNLTKKEIEDRVHFLRQQGLNPIYPELERSDFEEGGGHMLNSGHRKYADFVTSVLDEAPKVQATDQ